MAIGINFNSDWNQLMEEAELKRKSRELKEIVIKPWGKYETTYDGAGFKVKVITVNPGQRLSLQRHRWREEGDFWVAVELTTGNFGTGDTAEDATRLALEFARISESRRCPPLRYWAWYYLLRMVGR